MASTSNTPVKSVEPINSHYHNIDQDKSVLYLEKNHVTFDAPDRKHSIFFDECNRDVISIYNARGSKTRVIFQTTDQVGKLDFSIPIEKRILSIKLNRDRTIIAYHIEKSIVEFVNINYSDNGPELEARKYVQACRSRNSKLLGFIWTNDREIVFISDISIELFSVEPKRQRLKHLKSFNSSTNWFVYQPKVHDCDNPYSVLMISTGSIGNAIQPFIFCDGQISRLDKFVVDGDWDEANSLELFEQSITIAYIYGKVRLLVLQHESLNVKSRGAQVLIYTVFEDSGQTIKTHTLDLNLDGRFALNVLDNLVIAHDQPSKTSLLFDIMIPSTEKYDCPKHFVNIGKSQSIRPSEGIQSKRSDMYSADWVFFQPNFIIDVKRGVVFTLHIDLARMHSLIQDKNLLLDFLSFRHDSEDVILSLARDIVANSIMLIRTSRDIHVRANILSDVTSSFEIIRKLLISPRMIDTEHTDKTNIHREFISQEDFNKRVLSQLVERDDSDIQYAVLVLQEFIYLLRDADKDIDPAIIERFVVCLLKCKRFYQLILMMRTNILQDSKNLGCLLISLRSQWKPALQLGKEMLRRLDCISDILEKIN